MSTTRLRGAGGRRGRRRPGPRGLLDRLDRRRRTRPPPATAARGHLPGHDQARLRRDHHRPAAAARRDRRLGQRRHRAGPRASSRSACRRTSGAATTRAPRRGRTRRWPSWAPRSAPPKAPAQYSEADGINFAEIAKTTPDVILAAYSGLTKADYDKLSKIAPGRRLPRRRLGHAVAGVDRMIGKALGRSAQADEARRRHREDHQGQGRRLPAAGRQDLHLRQPRARQRRRHQHLHAERQPSAVPVRDRHEARAR